MQRKQFVRTTHVGFNEGINDYFNEGINDLISACREMNHQTTSNSLCTDIFNLSMYWYIQ